MSNRLAGRTIGLSCLAAITWLVITGSASAQECALSAEEAYVALIPDRHVFAPGETFTAFVALKNDGACDWPTGTRLVHVAGERLGPEVSRPGLWPVEPGTLGKFGVELQAPRELGSYVDWWQFLAPDGRRFGDYAWVQIGVGPYSEGHLPWLPPDPPRPKPADFPGVLARYLTNALPWGEDDAAEKAAPLLQKWTDEPWPAPVLEARNGFLLVHTFGHTGVIGTQDRLVVFRFIGNPGRPGWLVPVWDSNAFDRFGFTYLAPADNFAGDINGNGKLDFALADHFCTHGPCIDDLQVYEWDGNRFVDILGGRLRLWDAEFVVRGRQIAAFGNHEGEIDGGPDRLSTEIWQWNGQTFTRTYTIDGPPQHVMHLVHDGDAAMARGEYQVAAALYERAINDRSLPDELMTQDGRFLPGGAVIRAYARFKLLVERAVSGDRPAAALVYERLVAENPPGSDGEPYARLGQAFWTGYTVEGRGAIGGCEEAVALAEREPSLAARLSIGRENPRYRPRDLCRLALSPSSGS